MLQSALWFSAAFISGAIPYSLIVGCIAVSADIRDYGDNNPGATNVLRAAGVGWFIVAMLLDGFKAAIPVGLAWFMGDLPFYSMLLVSIAPALGHMFSPFLKFKGGKAVAATFGIWAGLTIGTVPTMLGILLYLFYRLLTSSGWSITLAFFTLGGYVFFWQPVEILKYVWVLNLGLLMWKHRDELLQWPALKNELRLFGLHGVRR